MSELIAKLYTSHFVFPEDEATAVAQMRKCFEVVRLIFFYFFIFSHAWNLTGWKWSKTDMNFCPFMDVNQFRALTGSDLRVRGAGERGWVERRGLAAVGGGGLMVMMVRRCHPNGAPSQVLQLSQPLGEGQRARFDLVYLLTMTWAGGGGVTYFQDDHLWKACLLHVDVSCAQITSCLKSRFKIQGLHPSQAVTMSRRY